MRRSLTGRLLSGGAAAAGLDKTHRRTPNHPPYSEMVAMALQVLGDEGGSTEAAISVHIQSSFTDIPWGHDRLLPYYLGRLVAAGELISPSPGHYQLPLRALPSRSFIPTSFTLPRRRGRPPLSRSNPSSSPVFSPLRRGRGRRPMRRRRGGSPIAQLAEGVPRRRGRPPLRRFRFRRSGSTKRGYDDFVVGKEGGWLCLEADDSGQSEVWSFCGELRDAEAGLPFEASGQSEQGEGRMSPRKGPILLGLEQSEHGCKQFSPEKALPYLEPEDYVEHREGQLTPGELQPYAILEVSADHGDWQSSAGEAPEAVATEQSLLGEEQAFVAAEYEEGQASPGQGLLLAAPEESELVGAMVIQQPPDGEEAVSTRQRKARGKKRRLWFEG